MLLSSLPLNNLGAQTLEDMAAQYETGDLADERVVRLVRLIQEHRSLSKYLNDFTSSIERHVSAGAFNTPGCQARAAHVFCSSVYAWQLCRVAHAICALLQWQVYEQSTMKVYGCVPYSARQMSTAPVRRLL